MQQQSNMTSHESLSSAATAVVFPTTARRGSAREASPMSMLCLWEESELDAKDLDLSELLAM